MTVQQEVFSREGNSLLAQELAEQNESTSRSSRQHERS